MLNARRPLLIAAGVSVAAVLALTAAWALDGHAHDGRVVRNVMLGGRPVGGMRRPALVGFVDDLSARYDKAAIAVDAPEGGLRSDAPELGVSVDRPATVAGAFALGHTGSAPGRMLSWVVHLFRPHRAAAVLHIDAATVGKVVAAKDPARVPPVEPSLAIRDGHVVGVAGRPGRGIDAAAVARELARADLGREPVTVKAGRAPAPPRFASQDADRLAERAESMATAGFTLEAGSQSVDVQADTFRRWVTAVPGTDALGLGADAGAVTADLPGLFPDPVVAPIDAGFTVSGGSVAIVAGKAGSGCCAPEAVKVVADAIGGPATPPQPIVLPLREIAPKRDEAAARKLGIVEQVATFTTPHNPGEPRVHNIHLIADTARGTVIEPGSTFSLNGLIGPRTTAKGYVDAPVIGDNQTFSTSIGGGISQFTTTLFNAAFFAGLEIPEYQMHGLYISRYPYGREATISFPAPDLKVRNTTPYGILIWPTYTETSITVTMYSTRYVDASQSNQSKTPKGPCTSVTTERTRKYLDGRSSVDRFFALYSPMEGVNCT